MEHIDVIMIATNDKQYMKVCDIWTCEEVFGFF